MCVTCPRIDELKMIEFVADFLRSSLTLIRSSIQELVTKAIIKSVKHSLGS